MTMGVGSLQQIQTMVVMLIPSPFITNTLVANEFKLDKENGS